MGKHLSPIKNFLKLSLKIIGNIACYFPLKIKKLLALMSRLIVFDDTLSRWNYLLMEEIFCSVNKPVIVVKSRFKVFDSYIHYNMRLDLSNGLQRVYYFLNYGQDLLKIMKDNLKKDSVFIDVGANMGYFTMLASSIIKRGRIISFEPSSLNYNILLNNTKGSIAETYRTALSNKNGNGKLYINKKSTGWHSFIGTGRHENVRISRFDELNLGLLKIDLIKIDVERHELEVLKGMKKSLLKYSPKVICEVDGHTEKKVIDFMSGIGYKSKRFEGKPTYDLLFEKI